MVSAEILNVTLLFSIASIQEQLDLLQINNTYYALTQTIYLISFQLHLNSLQLIQNNYNTVPFVIEKFVISPMLPLGRIVNSPVIVLMRVDRKPIDLTVPSATVVPPLLILT